MQKNKDKLPGRNKQSKKDNLTPAIKALIKKLDDDDWQFVTFEFEKEKD